MGLGIRILSVWGFGWVLNLRYLGFEICVILVVGVGLGIRILEFGVLGGF